VSLGLPRFLLPGGRHFTTSFIITTTPNIAFFSFLL
jgi:hypothetical protein